MYSMIIISWMLSKCIDERHHPRPPGSTLGKASKQGSTGGSYLVKSNKGD
jgi:hypothetical protein